MDDWRKTGDKCNQDLARIKSNCHYKKPPPGGSSNCQQNIPYWEKRFVSSVGSLSWKKFLEAKKFTHLYDNIMRWDDSAGEKAFQTAKDRFYSNFHGLPCDVELHNPDLYIDKIDWNAGVDHDLIRHLESEPVVPDSQHEPVVIFGDILPDPYKDFSPYGWGDSDEKIKKSWGISDDHNEINWDDYIDNGRIIWDECEVAAGNNWWVSDGDENYNKAGDQGWNTNSYDNSNYYPSYGDVNNAGDQAGNDGWISNEHENDNKAGDQGWDTNKYDNSNHYSSYGKVNNESCMSSHKTWRFHGNNNQRNRSWKNNGNWKKSTGQSYGNQRGHGSTIQAHGSQRIHVYP